MNKEQVAVTVKEARDFIKRAEAFIKDADQSGWTGSAVSGALRRQSMELTRALSAMRRP